MNVPLRIVAPFGSGVASGIVPAFAGPIPHAPLRVRLPLEGGTYDPITALNLMNAWFFVSVSDGEVGIYRVENDGTLTFLSRQDFLLLVENISVAVLMGANGAGTKIVPVSKFWLVHAQRRQCRIVFEPARTFAACEYNQWRGFAVTPKAGTNSARSLLRHIHRIICKRNKVKFKYLMRWLAWSVQNPHKHAEVVVVLQSATEGTGKSTLGNVMLKIFDRHGLLVEHHDRLLGKFNSQLETTCFILGEELFWAGDRNIADALKSRITSDTIPIEAKYRNTRQVPSHLHVMLTTNHEWAVSAGAHARRFFVVEVSDEVAQDPAWFGPLYDDLEAGGTEEFLHLLLNLKLGTFHPRNVPKTAELAQQQYLSAPPIEQWLLACVESEYIVGHPGVKQLGQYVETSTLHEAFCKHTAQRGARAESQQMFGRLMTAMFGPSRRASVSNGQSRAMGYDLPDADGIRVAVDKRLGIGRR